MNKIGIIGSGTWGTALANILAMKGHKVTLYSHFKEECEYLSKTLMHPNLRGTKLEKTIEFSNDLKSSIIGKDVIVFSSPSIFQRKMVNESKQYLKPNQILVNVAKGIEENTLLTMSEVIQDEVGKEYRVVSLSGPTHAEEVVKGLPTCIVATSNNLEASKKIQDIFAYEQFRVYTNSDPKGVEVAAALKNIIALACGISEGIGFGDNAKAALMTRGLFEITKLGVKLGCDPLTFSGLAGVGDIIVTSISNHSRNHNAGVLLGQGHSLKDTLQEVGMVVEGINSLNSARQLAKKLQVETPIIDAVYAVAIKGRSPVKVVNELFSRKLIGEKLVQK